MHSPISTPGRSGPGCSSNVKLPTAGGSVRRNWTAINQLASGLSGQAENVTALRAQVNALKFISRKLIELHPFKIYTLPSILRRTPTTADWRTFIIRAGRVLGQDATGTDADANTAVNSDPDSEYIPTWTTPTPEIIVDSGQSKHWFWLEINGTTATVKHGSNATADTGSNPWTTRPVPDATHIPIGWVDTATKASTRQPIIRQLLRADVISVGGGTITPYKLRSVQGNYLTCYAYGGPEDSPDIYIAKAPQLRHATPEGDPGLTSTTVYLTETIEGQLVDYTWETRTDNLDGLRRAKLHTDTTPTSQQMEIVVPVYLTKTTDTAASIIFASTANTGLTTDDPLDFIPITLQDLNIDARAWCQIA